jgi:hypothetical protein
MPAKSELEFPKVFDFSAVDKKDFMLFQLPTDTVRVYPPLVPVWAYIYFDKETNTELILVTHVQIEKKLYPPIATLTRIFDMDGVHKPVYVTVLPIDRVSFLLHAYAKRAYRQGYYRGKRNATTARRILSQLTPNIKIRSKRSKYPIKHKNLVALSKLSKIAKEFT